MSDWQEQSFLVKLRLIYLFTLGGSFIIVSLIFLAPYLQSLRNPIGSLIYAIFSPFCHQSSSRCFQLWGHPLAVCGRCTGIYLGSLLGLVIYPLLGALNRPFYPPLLFFVLFSLPIGIDSIGNFAHLWATSIWIRFATGIIWGLILPFYFLYGLSDALSRK